MKSFFKRFISQFLVLCLIGLPFTVQAGMIGTDEVIAQSQDQSDRNKVRDFMARAEVQQQLQDHGIGLQAAQARVSALTDLEVQQIAGKIDAIPAGADGGATVAIVLAVIVLIYILLQYFYPKAK